MSRHSFARGNRAGELFRVRRFPLLPLLYTGVCMRARTERLKRPAMRTKLGLLEAHVSRKRRRRIAISLSSLSLALSVKGLEYSRTHERELMYIHVLSRSDPLFCCSDNGRALALIKNRGEN